MDATELDALLTVLTAHRVQEFTGNGVSVKLDLPYVPPAFMMAGDKPEERKEPTAPETGGVEPTQLDLEDVLYGAK